MSAAERKRRQRDREKAQHAFAFDRPQEKAPHSVTSHVTKQAIDNNVTSNVTISTPAADALACFFCGKGPGAGEYMFVWDGGAMCSKCAEGAHAYAGEAFGELELAMSRRHQLGNQFLKRDFLTWDGRIRGSVVCNPPFDHVQEFCEHALDLDADKVAMICLVASAQRRALAARTAVAPHLATDAKTIDATGIMDRRRQQTGRRHTRFLLADIRARLSGHTGNWLAASGRTADKGGSGMTREIRTPSGAMRAKRRSRP